METKSIQQFMNSYSVKMVIVTGLAIILLIPSFLIMEIINERITLSEEVKKDLYAQWGNKQVISGPVLNVPYSVKEPAEVSQTGTDRRGVAHFLPETLQAYGTLHPETRQRGIYKVVVYESKIKLKGSFTQPDANRLDLQNAQLHWDAAYFTAGISDVRGIKNLPEMLVNGQKFSVEPGVADTDLFSSGLTVKTPATDLQQPFDFEIELTLNGSEDLSVEALGKESKVSLQSDWTHPGFTGQFLPARREVNEYGFTADWQVTHLNRNFPQQWADKKFTTETAKLGVQLLIPVDHYQKSMRSAKYAILFIALNFLVFLFIEIKSQIRIHPFQYVMVAFALLIFYALLTSLSEQIGFNAAYIISAASVISLITWYVASIFRERQSIIQIPMLLTGLYVFLYIILHLQDYALLAGTIGLFVILAIVMQVSRKIKWYSE
jgi:inner membrane protein